MPTKKTTKPPYRPRKAALPPNRPVKSGKDSPEKKVEERDLWKTIRENFGWGLVIGLPIILVIVALLFRATDGFTFRPAPTPFPTIAPTPTAGSFVAPPEAPANAQRNRVLFLATPEAGKPNQVYTANSDGSDVRQLTRTNEFKSNPVWSPDGKTIAFTASNVGIQTINFDGSGLRTLVYNGFSPVWSPDGKQIAFLRQDSAQDGRGPDGTGSVRILYVTKSDGKPGDERQLAYDALSPAWSPNNETIAYFSLKNLVMFTIRAGGDGRPTQIKVPAGLGAWNPVFAPDGVSLIFYGSLNAPYLQQGLDNNLNFLTPTATPAPTFTPLPNITPNTPAPTNTPVPTTTPTPQGSPTPTGGFTVNLYQVNVDGSNLKQLAELENNNNQNIASYFAAYLTNSGEVSPAAGTRPFYRVSPVFSPDGKRVAALSTNKELAGLVVVALDGSIAPAKVADGGEAGLRISPTFSTDGAKLIYSFQPPDRGSKVSLKVFDIAAKTETNFTSNNFPVEGIGFPTCCGFVK
jgi:dipeptidyl aminopeptidase/acylaminoacyl peptidase